jgi:PAS domain S-box-containing protein
VLDTAWAGLETSQDRTARQTTGGGEIRDTGSLVADAAGEDRFRALLESAPDAMVIVDGSGVIQLVNAQAELMFGYSRDELLGRSVELLVPERFRGRHALHRDAYAGTAQVRPMGAGLELHGQRKDGHEFPVEISLSPLDTAGGQLVSAAVRDVTDRKAAQKRVSELAAIVESSQDAIITTTLEGEITFWNAAAEQLYGYPSADVAGRHISILAPAGCQREVELLLERLSRGEKVEHYETLRMARDSTTLHVDVTLWPVRDLDGTVVGASAIIRDISALKHAEQQLTRLYEQQQHVALTLQRSLMGTPADIPGLEMASRYLPATQGAGVGGDWFDLISLSDGRVGVLIGDVMGRGLEAAAVMGQLRSAANALARTGMAPARLIQFLDAVVTDLPDQMATCCYLLMEPDAGVATICSAGHLPVLVVDPGGAAVYPLPAPVSVPLGVGDIEHREARLTVPADATLVLYTDGLVEGPGSDLDTRISALQTALSTATAAGLDLDEIADRVSTKLLSGLDGHSDDVTLVLLRTPPACTASAAIELAASAESVPDARLFADATLSLWGWHDGEGRDTILLLTSEVVTNAVRHGHGPIRLRLRLMRQHLAVEVTDSSAVHPQSRRIAPDAESGRGLSIITALAEDWGIRPTSDGKTVWFTVPCGI